MSYFTKKRRSLGMYAAVTIALLALCTWRLEIDWGLILANFQVSVVRFTKTYLPMDFSQLREQLYQGSGGNRCQFLEDCRSCCDSGNHAVFNFLDTVRGGKQYP